MFGELMNISKRYKNLKWGTCMFQSLFTDWIAFLFFSFLFCSKWMNIVKLSSLWRLAPRSMTLIHRVCHMIFPTLHHLLITSLYRRRDTKHYSLCLPMRKLMCHQIDLHWKKWNVGGRRIGRASVALRCVPWKKKGLIECKSKCWVLVC